MNKESLAEIRLACEKDLWTFAQVVEPHRVYGDIHKKVYKWWQYEVGDKDSLVLIPRDHQKSHCAAVRAAWEITRDPTITILYVSATSTLAVQQLYDIKQILTSKIYRRLWPEMLEQDEGKREKWTETEIKVDHPKRKEAGVRDNTIFAAGLTTNTTGLHAKMVIKDDVVVPDNAYTEEGREKVNSACSMLASVLTTDGIEVCVGTRYHPLDHYATLIDMKSEIINDNGDITGWEKVYETMEYPVEEDGVFLWPKVQGTDGQWRGFDWKILAKKKAKYIDKARFYAQYYNDPNDPDSRRLDRDRFQYYNESKVKHDGLHWHYDGKRLNVYAAVDFATSTAIKADWTAMVVIGVDCDGYIYVLDMVRFKTNKVEKQFQQVLALHSKWEFKKLRAEVSASQKAIVEYLKDRAREEGMRLAIDEYRPTRNEGAKAERIAGVLEPRYENLTILHPKSGLVNQLEEELVLSRPAHDDLKDALAMAVSIAKAPSKRLQEQDNNNVVFLNYNSKFGGVA